MSLRKCAKLDIHSTRNPSPLYVALNYQTTFVNLDTGVLVCGIEEI
jgi:hypothetical protein